MPFTSYDRIPACEGSFTLDGVRCVALNTPIEYHYSATNRVRCERTLTDRHRVIPRLHEVARVKKVLPVRLHASAV